MPPTSTPNREWDASTEIVDGTVFVAVRLRNEAAVPRRVRVTNRLDGPVLPPRRQGIPEPGWDDEGYEGVVPPSGVLALGFACRTPGGSDSGDPRRPPVAVEWRGRADSTDRVDTPAELVQRLGSPAPPRDAIPDRIGDRGERAETGDDSDLPPSLRAWFDEVEQRIERRERLTRPSVAEATSALDAAGGLAAVDALAASACADEPRLAAVAKRAVQLRERQAATDVSTSALRKLRDEVEA